MKEDELLALIRNHVRTERSEDTLLEAVARGDASTQDLEELEKRAASDRSLAVGIVASQPMGESAIDRIAARVERERVKVDSHGEATKAETKRKVVPLFARTAVLAIPLALAAAIALRVATSGSDELPAYALEVSSAREMRGPSEVTSRIVVDGADGRFSIVARPDHAAKGPLAALAFVTENGNPTALDLPVEVAEGGSVRLAGSTALLQGATEVRIVIGEASAISASNAAEVARDANPGSRVRVLRVSIDRRP